MVNTIFIVNEAFKTQQVLTIQGERTFFDDIYTLDLATCTETFEFSTNVTDIEETDYVLFYYHKEYRLFQITEIEQEHSEGKIITHVYAECACLELLNNAVRPFEGEFNCISFFNYILTGTRWTIGQYSSSLAEKVVNVNVKNTTQIWTLMQEYMAEFGYEFSPRVTYGSGHVKRFYIDVFSEGNLGNKTYKRFEYGRNVSGIIKKKDLYEFCTALILDTDKDVVNVEYNKSGYIKEKGSDVVIAKNENKTYNFGRDYIYGSFEDNESPSGEEVVTKAVEELKKRAVPHFDYEVTTAMTFEEYDDINLGDTVYVIDHTFTPKLTLEARIGELQISFTDRNNCSCNLTNYKEVKSKISVTLSNGIKDAINNYFPITAEKLADGAVTTDKINTQTYDVIIADSIGASKIVTQALIAEEIKAVNGEFDKIKADKASIEQLDALNAKIDNLDVGDLSAVYANINELDAKKANIEELDVINARIDNLDVGDLSAVYAQINKLNAEKANIVDLNVVSADINRLDANYADITRLVSNKANISDLNATNAVIAGLDTKYATIDLANIKDGCITTAMIGNGVITTAQIADSSITDAKIVELSANRITAGTLSVERLILTGSDKSLVFALNNSGDLISTQVDTLDAHILTEKTITADKIVSKAITAEQIASKTITANEIVANTITGNEIKSNTITANHISGKELVGITIRNAENSFSVSAGGSISGCDLSIGETVTNPYNNKTMRRFRVTNEGNLKVGGYSAYTHTDGYTKGIAEITSLGTVWSCSETEPFTYAKLTEGKLEVGFTGHDPEYQQNNGYFLDNKITISNGQIAISGAKDTTYSSYQRELYLSHNTIGSALGHVDFVNRIHVTGSITTTSNLILGSNAIGLRGVETSGEEIALVSITSNNVSTYGYGSYANQGSYAYQAGTQLLGGDKVTIKSKNIIFLGCNDGGRLIRFYMNDEGAYGFRPNGDQKDIAFGSSTYPWKSVTAVTVNQTSDRTLKENIKYISNANTINDDNVTLQDCYNFIKNDLPIATYNYIHETEKSNKIGFIAQDLLCNTDGTDNKVGQLIIDRLKYTEEDGKLTYDTNNLYGVMLSAMQVMANKIEALEAQLNNL